MHDSSLHAACSKAQLQTTLSSSCPAVAHVVATQQHAHAPLCAHKKPRMCCCSTWHPQQRWHNTRQLAAQSLRSPGSALPTTQNTGVHTQSAAILTSTQSRGADEEEHAAASRALHSTSQRHTQQYLPQASPAVGHCSGRLAASTPHPAHTFPLAAAASSQ